MADEEHWIKLDRSHSVETNGIILSKYMAAKLCEALKKSRFKEGVPHTVRLQTGLNAELGCAAIPLIKNVDFKEIPKGRESSVFYFTPSALVRVAGEIEKTKEKLKGDVQHVFPGSKPFESGKRQWVGDDIGSFKKRAIKSDKER